MSNFLLKNPDCVFIHIPKTGGSTIRLGLWDRRYEGPVFGHVPPEWQGLFKFAFVRHPIERVESAYRDFVQNRKQRLTPEQFAAIVLDNTIDYTAPTEGSWERKIRHHTIPMTHPYNCIDRADFVGFFETYEQSLRALFDKLDAPHPDNVPHIRATKGHGPIFKGRIRARLVEFYKEDFETFDYEL